jgi:hypothetical protein
MNLPVNNPVNYELPAGWPKQAMPARLPPNNAHLTIDTSKLNQYNLFLGHAEVTTYKLLIDCYRCWDETILVGPTKVQGQFSCAGIHYAEGFSFVGLQRFIIRAEKTPGVLIS